MSDEDERAGEIVVADVRDEEIAVLKDKVRELSRRAGRSRYRLAAEAATAASSAIFLVALAAAAGSATAAVTVAILSGVATVFGLLKISNRRPLDLEDLG